MIAWAPNNPAQIAPSPPKHLPSKSSSLLKGFGGKCFGGEGWGEGVKRGEPNNSVITPHDVLSMDYRGPTAGPSGVKVVEPWAAILAPPPDRTQGQVSDVHTATAKHTGALVARQSHGHLQLANPWP